MSYYHTILQKIGVTVNALTGSGKPISKVYGYPKENLAGYPAIVYYPISFDNNYLTNAENLKGYAFKVFVVCEATQKNIAEVFTDILPKAVDAVIEKFDEDWSQGSLDGHRVWWKLQTGNWTITPTEKGAECVADLTLIVNLITNN